MVVCVSVWHRERPATMASAARQPRMEDIRNVARSQTNPPVTIKIHYYNKATARDFECAYHTTV